MSGRIPQAMEHLSPGAVTTEPVPGSTRSRCSKQAAHRRGERPRPPSRGARAQQQRPGTARGEQTAGPARRLCAAPGPRKGPGAHLCLPGRALGHSSPSRTAGLWWQRGLCGSERLHSGPHCAGPLRTDGSQRRVLTGQGPLEQGLANHSSVLASGTT